MALRKITREDVDRLRMPMDGLGDARGMVDPRALEALAWNQPYDVDAREAEVQAARDRIAAALVAQQGMPPPLAAAAANQMVSSSSVFGGDTAQGVNSGSGGQNSVNQGSQSFSDMLGLNPTGFYSGAPPANSNPDDQSLNEGDREGDTQTAAFDTGGLVSMAAGLPGGFTTANASMVAQDPDVNSLAEDGGINDIGGVHADGMAFGNSARSGFNPDFNQAADRSNAVTAPATTATAPATTPADPNALPGQPGFQRGGVWDPDVPTDEDVVVSTVPPDPNPNTPYITVTPHGRAPVSPAPSRSFGTPTPDFVAPTAPGFDLGSPAPGGTDFGPGAYGGFTGGSGNTGGFGAGYSGSSDMGNTQGAQGFTSGFSAGFEAGMAAMSGGYDGGSGSGDGAGDGAGAGAGDGGGSSAGGSDGASGGVG